jgi:hypothetical protein
MLTERFRICWQGTDPEPHRGVWFVAKREAAQAIVAGQNRIAQNVEYWLEVECDRSQTGEWHAERINDETAVRATEPALIE